MSNEDPRSVPTAEIKDTDWAYAAGFVDGEGCIAITKSFNPTRGRFAYGVAVVVTNCERDVLDWMHEHWGGWVVQMRPGGSKTRPSCPGEARPALRLSHSSVESLIGSG